MPKLHPQMQAILEMLAQQNAGKPQLQELSPAEARQVVEQDFIFWNEDAPTIAGTLDILAHGPGGSIPLRMYDPSGGAEKSGCVFYFHGGGWVVCSIATHDGVCRRLANYSGLKVVSVGYRLAPENKFPSQLEDCVSAVRWVSAHAADFNIDSSRLLLCGDSAGANLSLATALHFRDQRQTGVLTEQIQGTALLYGCYDTDFETDSYRAFGGVEYLLSQPEMIWFWNHYLKSEADRQNPLAAPLHANLTGLPPYLVIAAEFDPLFEDSERLVDKLQSVHARYEYVVWPGVTHACIHMTRMLDPAEAFLRQVGHWLGQPAHSNSYIRNTGA